MNTLKESRIRKGLTQREVAAQAKVTERNYQYYECGERVPNARTAIRIAQALSTTVEDLWGNTPPVTQATFSV